MANEFEMAATRRLAGILIGGESRRMGVPKHLLNWHGQPLLAHLVAVVRPFVSEIFLLGAGEIPAEFADFPRLADAAIPSADATPTDRHGPLAGVLAALRAAPDAAWLITSCDLPLLSSAAVAWLWQHYSPGDSGVMATDDAGIACPFPAIYDGRLLPAVESLWLAARRAPKHLASHPAMKTLHPPPEIFAAWRNINTPDEWGTLADSEPTTT